MDTVPQKRCSKCGEEKPLTDFYVKDKRTGRLQADCKRCHVARTSAHIAANRRHYSDLARDYYRDNAAELRKRAKERRLGNPDAERAAQARYRERHREELKRRNAGRDRAYYQTNRDAIIEQRRRYRQERAEAIRASKRRHYGAHRDDIYAANHRRRSRILANGGAWAPTEWEAIKRAQDYRCLMCGRREPRIKLTVDHVVPISLGGRNVAANIQGLCKPCNSRKGTKATDYRRAHPNG